MLNHTSLKRLFTTVAILVPTAASAHWDRPSCYIEVHSGCYVNQTQPCSDQDYKDFLRNCDETYPSLGGNRGKRPKNLVAPG